MFKTFCIESFGYQFITEFLIVKKLAESLNNLVTPIADQFACSVAQIPVMKSARSPVQQLFPH